MSVRCTVVPVGVEAAFTDAGTVWGTEDVCTACVNAWWGSGNTVYGFVTL